MFYSFKCFQSKHYSIKRHSGRQSRTNCFRRKPRTATVQANIISSTTGALNYNATETTGHYFKIGNNIATTSITSNESETAIFSHNAFEFARITNVGVAKWLGNANTATKLETARTINGVAFDGTKDITIYNTEGHLVFPNGAEFWIG